MTVYRVNSEYNIPRKLTHKLATARRSKRDTHLGHQDDDAKAEHIRMMLREPTFVGHGMLGTTFAFEGAVAPQVQQPIVWRGQSAHGLGGEPPQQGFGTPLGGAEQTTIVVVSQVPRALPR